MKKIIRILLLLCCLSGLSFPAFAAEQSTDADHFASMGTTPSNLRLGGRTACDGENVYYSVLGEGIFCTGISGGGSTMVVSLSDFGSGASDRCDFQYLNAAGGALYFYYEGSGNTSGIYAYRPGGGISRILSGKGIVYLGMSAGRLIYCQAGEYVGASDGVSGEYGFSEIPAYSMSTFYEMNTDGTGRRSLGAVIPVSSSWDLLVTDERIFYVDVTNRDMPLYSVKKDGSDRVQLSAGYTHFGESPCYDYGGYIYFCESSIDTMADGTRVVGSSTAYCRVRPDGTGKESLPFPEDAKIQMGFANALDGRCYIPVPNGIVWVVPGAGQSGSIYQKDEMTDMLNMLYTVPGWLYFTSTVYPSDYVKPTAPGNYTVKQDEAFCRIRVDGSGFEEIHRKPGAVSFTHTIFY